MPVSPSKALCVCARVHAGFCLAVASGGYCSLQCGGFSSPWLLLLWSTGFRTQGSIVSAPGLSSTGDTVVVHRLGCSVACGIFPDQGWNLYLLHWQVNSLPLSHQGSPWRL